MLSPQEPKYYGEQEVYELAQRASVLAFQELLKNRREQGFKHFYLDLMREPRTTSRIFDAALRQGWVLEGGLLTVYENADSNELMDFLEAKLGHYPWFETRRDEATRLSRGEDIPRPTLPAGFEAYTQNFKTLGKYGANTAIDVIAFIQNPDDTLSVQVIVRPSDKKYAFVGGIIENKEATLERCYMETLEEFYSNDLFARNSGTELLAKQMKFDEVKAGFARVLQQKEFETLGPVMADITREYTATRDFPSCIERLRVKLLSYANQDIRLANGKVHKHRTEDLEHLFVLFRCHLYKTMLPLQYGKFINFLQSQLHEMNLTTNESDPRNTNKGYMDTIPHWFSVSRDEMLVLERECKIKPKGGDDAVSTNIVPIETLFGELSMYAAHARLGLEALVNLFGLHPEVLNRPAIQAQLQRLEAHLTAREASTLNLVRFTGGASSAAVGGEPGPVMQKTRAGAMQLPEVSSIARVEQLRAVDAATLPPESMGSSCIQVTDPVMEAKDHLVRMLGAERFAKIEEKMENEHIPLSALVALADLSTLETAVVVIDNSGSTTGGMTVLRDDGTRETVSRWSQERERVRILLPLLAYAGIQVEFRFLNPAPYEFERTRTGQIDLDKPAKKMIRVGEARSFDFRPPRNHLGQVTSADITGLEAKLVLARQFIDQVFEGTPSGSTKLMPAIQSTLAQIKNDNKRRGVFFVTDGELDLSDKIAVQQTLRTRLNPELSPFMVSACINESASITWARDLQDNPSSHVRMLDDYSHEVAKMKDMHGEIVPYSRALWVVLHIALPKDATHSLARKGVFLYHVADQLKADEVLTKDQVDEMVGYRINARQYDLYLAARAEAVAQSLLDPAEQAYRRDRRCRENGEILSAAVFPGGIVSAVAVPPGTAQQLGTYGLMPPPPPAAADNTSTAASAAPRW